MRLEIAWSVVFSLAAGCGGSGQGGLRFGPVEVAGEAGDARTPDLVEWDGAPLVVWSEDRGEGPDLFAAALDREGEVRGIGELTGCRAARRPRVVKIGERGLVAWTDRRDGMMQVWTGWFDPAGGGVQEGADVSASPLFPSTDPRLAAAGEGAVLIWTERGVLQMVQRVLLDQNGRPVSEAGPVFGVERAPHGARLAVSGERSLVVAGWFSRGIWGVQMADFAHVDRQPEITEPDLTTGSPLAPAVGELGDGFLVAVRDLGPRCPSVRISLVGPDGEVQEPGEELPLQADYVHDPIVVPGVDFALVLCRAEFSGRTDLVAVRVGEDGMMSDPVVLLEDVGLGEPVSARVLGGDLCLAFESLAEGRGRVQVACLAVPGEGS